jgi:hypothetical protein
MILGRLQFNLYVAPFGLFWWPRTTSNKDLWKATGQEGVKLGTRERKFG